MKTININLIGEFKKTVKSGRFEIKKDSLDSGTKFFVIIFVIATFVVLSASFGVWLVAENLAKSSKVSLEKLTTELTELKNREAVLSAYTKDLENKRKMAELKLRAKKQINNLFIPWSLILTELSQKVPKKIIVTDIQKLSSGKITDKMVISGIVSAENKPLTAVSFFILNINEDKNSLLADAEIKTLEYKDEKELYEFEIEAKLDQKQTGQYL